MFDGLPTSPDEGITNDADIWNDIEIVLKPDPGVSAIVVIRVSFM